MIGPEVSAPDVTEAVVGFRTFALKSSSQHNYALYGPHTNKQWPTPRITARCNNTIQSEHIVLDGVRPKQHTAPAKGCGCGIYVYFDPCPVTDYTGLEWHGMRSPFSALGKEVASIVTLTGKVEVHERGMRGQHAEIRALGLNPNLNSAERTALRELGKRWDIPVVDQDGLPRLATEYGRPLDKSLRPAKPALPAKPSLSHKAPPSMPTPALVAMEAMVESYKPKPWVPGWLAIVPNGTVAAVNIALVFVVSPGCIVGATIGTAFTAFMCGLRRARKSA